MDIALAERLGRKGSGDPEFAEMSFSIETTTVTAKSRGVKADISTEVLRELRNVHAVDGLGLLREIMENELVAETNRETVRKVYISAKNGSQQTTTANRFDLDVDANGRWFMEKFKGLVFHIKRECNIIHQETRTGPGNWIIVSADVAAALETTGLVSTDGVELNPNTCFFGTLVGGVKVYVDPYLNLSDQYQTMVVGRKGTSPWDAGLFYCPYVPIETFTIPYATNSFQPQVAMKSVYGMAYNPYIELDDGVAGTANMTPGINKYYRKSAIVNLM
jgi:hypothetical protein